MVSCCVGDWGRFVDVILLEAWLVFFHFSCAIFLVPSRNGHSYILSIAPATFATAVQESGMQSLNSMPGFLATVTSRSENDFISLVLPGASGWIAAQEMQAGWTWMSGPEQGAVLDFSLLTSPIRCAYYNKGQWALRDCQESMNYLIELCVMGDAAGTCKGKMSLYCIVAYI